MQVCNLHAELTWATTALVMVTSTASLVAALVAGSGRTASVVSAAFFTISVSVAAPDQQGEKFVAREWEYKRETQKKREARTGQGNRVLVQNKK